MAEDKSKKATLTKKKVSKKKTSKKKSKKAAAKKVAKKVMRKKASEKKPIKLKADSPELDSFAEHAAENIAGIEAAAVSLDGLSDSLTESNDELQANTGIKENTKSKKEVATVSETTKKEHKPKPKIEVEAYYKKPKPSSEQRRDSAKLVPQSSKAETKESLTGKLIVSLVLFAGLGLYLVSLFTQTPQTTIVKHETAAVTSLPGESRSSGKTEQQTVEQGIAKVIPTPVVSELSSGSTVASGETQPQDKSTTELAEKTPEKATSKQPEYFPPPPTPDFLKTSVKQPIPTEQMEMIKQTFAPEMYN